jgi:RNA recognition motif-containing protein
MNIYVSNINFRATEQELRKVFENFGSVSSVKIITDKLTGRSRGFGFVEMPNDAEGAAAIAQLNGTDFLDRTISVKQAEARSDSDAQKGGFNKGGGFQRGGSQRGNYHKRW